MSRDTASDRHLDTKGSNKPEASNLFSLTDMQTFHNSEGCKSHRTSSADSISFLDFGKADDLYGSKGAHDSGKGAHPSVQHMSDQQFDLGKAVQDWAGSVIDAGKHALEGLGKEAPKPAPEEREAPEEIKPFNPKLHGVGQIWSISDFEKWLKKNENNEEYIYPDDEPVRDIDPGFRLPIDRKDAPEIDRGFQIPSDRTTRKVIKDDGIKVSNDEAIEAILSGAR